MCDAAGDRHRVDVGGVPAEELHPASEFPATRRRSRSCTTAATTSRPSTGRSRCSTTRSSAPSRRPRGSRAGYLGIGFSTYIEACGHRALQGGRARSAPRPGLWESRQGARAPDREGHGLHRLALARPGARDDLRPAGGRRAAGHLRWTVEIVHGDTGPRPVRHGHLRQPLGRGGRLRHLHVASTRSRRRARRSPRTCSRRAEATSSTQEGKFGVKGSPGRGNAVRRGRADRVRRRTTTRRGSSRGSRRRRFYDPSNFCFPFGAHACVVEVDPDTGNVKILRYVAVDDVGQRHQPDDRRRHGARRHRPGRGPGALGGRGVRRRLGQLAERAA